MKTKHHLLIAALLLLPAWAMAQTITSAVPGTISYQGRVLNSAGGLVGAGTPVNRTVIFRIWDHPSNTLAGNLLYSEQQTVTIAEGEFSVLVGQGTGTSIQTFGYSETNKGPSGSPAVSLPNVFGGATRYLGVTVAAGASIQLTDNEITPRQQIVGSAFAFRARFAESIGSNGVSAITAVDGGNVGVGTSAPPALFTISGSNNSPTTNTPQLVITDPADLNERLLIGMDRTGNGSGIIQATKVGTGAQNLLLNPSGGFVGIGSTTAPTAALDVAGGIKASGTSGFTFNSGDLDGGLFSPSDGMVTLRTNGTERMRADANGNVGIGTTAPTNKLTISGSADITGNLGIGTASPGASTLLQLNSNTAVNDRIKLTGNNYNSTSSDSNNGVSFRLGDNALEHRALWLANSNAAINGTVAQLQFGLGNSLDYAEISSRSTNGAVARNLALNPSGGNVGIGTGASPPVAPLEVKGYRERYVLGNSFHKDHGNSINSMNAIQYISIKSEWFIEAFGFISVSDRRIKDIVRPSDTVSDLDTIQRLKVTDYRMIDQVQQGNTVQKGFIAQEVQKVIPEAVRKADGFIPNIYATARKVEFDEDSKTLSVTLDKAHELKAGDMVRLISDDGEQELKVTEVEDSKTFVVGSMKSDMKRVFVYGKQVDDFLSVDYNRIFTTGISAMQQLKKEKDAEVKLLKEENADLKAQVTAQTQRLADLEAKDKARDAADKARDAKLAVIEKLLLAADKPAAQPVALKKSAGGAE